MKIFSRVKDLKYAARFRGISISHDFMPSPRQRERVK